MYLNILLKNKNLSLYKLSKLSGIPLTTLNDLVNEKVDISKCNSKTIFALCKFLDIDINNLLSNEIELNKDFVTYKDYLNNERLKGENMKTVNELLEFLNHSHSEYQAINNLKNLLIKNEFLELNEEVKWNLKEGKNYFVIKDYSSIIAFKIPKKIDTYHFQISAAHSDSPCFKLKNEDDIISCGYNKINCESYGGLILSSWLDKPLSIAGRVIVNNGNSIETKLVDIDKDLLIIPNTCIHFNGSLNNGYIYNKNIDMVPIISLGSEKNSIKKLLSKELNIKENEINSYDLYLYNRQLGVIGGENSEFIFSSKIDNLESSFLTMKGLINSKQNTSINVCAVFFNEETGSLTSNGADSTFLIDTLRRINYAFKKEEDLLPALAKSFILSVDNAHAIHPNHPELSDANSPVYLNKGIVIKNNSNMSYTTNAFTYSVVSKMCEKFSIPYQTFYNRNDIRGGSTLGAISSSHVSIYSCDIGLAQLAMHSSYEVAGADDVNIMFNFMKNYFSSNIEIKDKKVTIK